MANDLAATLEKLHLSRQSFLDQGGHIDDILDQERPRKRPKKPKEELKKQLERDYLTPPKAFSTQWLNKLQQ